MSWTSRLSLLAAFVTVTIASCPSYEWTQFRDMCYWGRSDYGLYWRDVAGVCNMLYPGAEMVTIHDSELNTFIAEEIAGKYGSYDDAGIALSRYNRSSSWTWTDGSAVNFTQWYNNDPDSGGGDCGVINVNGYGMWAGHNCDTAQDYFMCQIAAH